MKANPPTATTDTCGRRQANPDAFLGLSQVDRPSDGGLFVPSSIYSTVVGSDTAPDFSFIAGTLVLGVSLRSFRLEI